MLRKILVVVAITVVSLFCLNGCKKDADDVQSDTENIKTAAQHKAEAKEQINKENMDEELDRLEKELEQDISEEEE